VWFSGRFALLRVSGKCCLLPYCAVGKYGDCGVPSVWLSGMAPTRR